MAARIRKGDRVIVIAGKDKGREGEVLRAIPKENRVVVAGVNLVTRHQRPTPADPKGGIRRFEAPIHVSNVALKDPKTGKPTRVRFEVRDGRKVRVAVKSGEVIG
ncbi:MAG: 50S ribosomal protein L24 [Sphingomonadaceae bacterium]|uniref:50S ribosomal protein L24 n=1 Tax=Thermaurantiacus sp. TaxID=2820283 RepID=UPI00298F359A|nr:50S ribosomal protein L24 [Thermaurantiacus sp.]MCS6986436.1 50S ribosomal protein L24 [Sphingomonadaceae bacterium]MDW8414303.1 50S ribosomal protein L24 [Thermaurantiacus sp.]